MDERSTAIRTGSLVRVKSLATAFDAENDHLKPAGTMIHPNVATFIVLGFMCPKDNNLMPFALEYVLIMGQMYGIDRPVWVRIDKLEPVVA